MKIQINHLRKIIAVTQSKWIGPALMAVALIFAVLGLTGCKPHH